MKIKRGDIYFVNLNPIQGREQSGERPVVVISINAINRRYVGCVSDSVTHNFKGLVRYVFHPNAPYNTYL